MQILPSGEEPAVPGPAGLALAPFRGVRYAQQRVTGLAEVTSPPYDVIGQDSAQHLRDADPHNVVRLILPPQVPGQPGAEYQEAARLLRDWLAEGVLAAENQPALYLYQQRLVDPALAYAVIKQQSAGRSNDGLFVDLNAWKRRRLGTGGNDNIFCCKLLA